MKKLLSILALLALTACASATTQSPDISASELKAEQEKQQAIIDAEEKKTKKKSNKITSAMRSRLKRVSRQVSKAGVEVCKELKTLDNCTLPFELDEENLDMVNAYTNGKKIVVAPAMMNFADTDNQLATVLAHEYAHALMEHPSKTGQNATVGGLLGLGLDVLAGSQGIQTRGMFSKMGANAAVMQYSQGFETEADYIGMYILKRAGYNVDKAAHLWRRMATVNPDGVYTGTSHPTSAQRYLLLDKTAKEIHAKKKSGQKLLPEFKSEE